MKTAKEWNSAIEDRRKVLVEDWIKGAHKVVGIYEAKDCDETPFNILYSNTETLLPALYNSTPRPEVSARYSSSTRDRRLDAAVAQTAERTLEYTADTNSGQYETFDEATRDAVLQALVPGQGQTRVKFKDYEGAQQICVESVAYDRFIWGYSRKWQHVPWVAYGYDLNQADFEEQFDKFTKKEVYKKIKWKEMETKANESRSIWDPDDDAAGKKKEPTLLVWECWSAADKKIYHLCDEFEEEFLDEEKYPFDLTSRFPSPKPLQFLKRVNTLTPKPLYEEYRTQAEELNEITNRLKRIVKAIRVRGIYHPALSVLETILTKDSENALEPAEQAQALADSGGLDKFIWMLPTEQLVQTALSLYDAREKCKQTIYEIMGIGDVLRGQSVASETAKAQEIKNQWGSLRVKRMQKDVQVFCRDTFRVALEFAANLYAPLTFKQITGLPWLFENQKKQLNQMMMQMQQQAQQMQQMQAQQPPGGPPPPQPPQPPPEAAYLAFPSWEQVIGILRGQFERQYRIDIETNSTVDLEATEDKVAIGEFMNAFGQMTAGLAPMVETGQLPFEASKVILGETFRRFRFGRRVQDALEMMQEPQPKPDMAIIQEKHAAEMVKVQAEAKRQIGEMQETVLEMTGDYERLKTENDTLKAKQELLDKATAVKAEGQKVKGMKREHDLRTTFQGTLKQQSEAAGQKVQAAEGKAKAAEGQVQEVKQKAQADEQLSQIQAAAEALAAQQKAFEDKVKTQAAADGQIDAREQAMLDRLEKSQQMFLDAMGMVAKAMTAKRQSRLEVGPDGSKRAVSEVVQ